jgi:hypothetical protein
MRPRLVALGCTVAGALGFLALPAAAAQASGPAIYRAKPALSISTPAGGYAYGAKVKLTVTLGKNGTDRAVSVYATPAGGARKLVITAKVGAKGKLYPAYRITRTTRFTVVFAGDAHHGAATASRTVTAAAQVADTISGYGKTTKISGVSYRVYQANGTLTLHATVTPAKPGECVEPETEQYDKGRGWDADTRYGCDKLDAKSSDTAPFSLGQAVGDRYRVRADYVPGAKDTANAAAHSDWLYFEVVK